MENIIEMPSLRNKEFVFADRTDAGQQLGELMRPEADDNGVLLAIPAGGVPVAVAMQRFIPYRLELLLVRKVQIPWNSEAGFGAINMDGSRFFNEPLLQSLHLSKEVIESQVQKAQRSINKRNTLFRSAKVFPDISGKKAILIDDGLASGYTMLAALRYVQSRAPAALIVAVPTGLGTTVARIAAEADRIYCPNIRQASPFAVANAYRHWYDVNDEEILRSIGVTD